MSFCWVFDDSERISVLQSFYQEVIMCLLMLHSLSLFHTSLQIVHVFYQHMFLSHYLFLSHHQSLFQMLLPKVIIRIYRTTCTKITSGVHLTSKGSCLSICPRRLLSNCRSTSSAVFALFDLNVLLLFEKVNGLVLIIFIILSLMTVLPHHFASLSCLYFLYLYPGPMRRLY